MRLTRSKIAVLILALAVVALVAPACGPRGPVETYLAVIPRVLHSGSTETVSLALFNSGELVTGDVEVSLLQGNREVAGGSARIKGRGIIEIDLPDLPEGTYQVRVKGETFEDTAQVTVEHSLLAFVETDKPIYKPGQTMHIRVIMLTPELTPVSGPVTVEVVDAKGIKIFRTETETDDFGMAGLDLPISTEPNQGVWKLTVITEKGRSQIDVRVEQYVLPKYEVTVELPREWFLVSERIQGRILSEYSFGNPVRGDLTIVASRYVGEWEEYATLRKRIDGDTDFDLPAVGYVAGVPAAGGKGNVILDITVTETATGYQEKTSRMLAVTESPVSLLLIPEGVAFKPGLPFGLLVVTETPDNQPLDRSVEINISYLDGDYEVIKTENLDVTTSRGKALVTAQPPAKAVAMQIVANTAEQAWVLKTVLASYSPSSSFIHVEQTSQGTPSVGDRVEFKVNSTRRAGNFYYEVVARDKVVFSDYTGSSTIAFDATPMMAPAARLLVYQILANAEVAADYIPFEVSPEYPHNVTAKFSTDEAAPGDAVDIDLTTEGAARVGIAVVDRSVFILAENRLNLQQVFDELERLYMSPQAELHEISIYPSLTTRGAMQVFDDAGVVVLSNNDIPEGEEFESPAMPVAGRVQVAMEAAVTPTTTTATAMDTAASADGAGLAEVQRVRQFFPETWLWQELTTDASGRATLNVTVPDTITTWMLRAVAISPEKGLGVAEDELRAFQPFFLKIDLPYSAIRGEEFPVQIAIYNYLDEAQSVLVEIVENDWFDLLDDTSKTVDIAANEIGGASFLIRPTRLGVNRVNVSARSPMAADAMEKTIIIAAEGVSREYVQNLTLAGGESRNASTAVPFDVVEGSARAYLTVTSSYLTQTIDGLDALLQMPFGCGEQNMILLAPDIYIVKYLQESGLVKPEIMAKAEKLMITGYQRELTYRRTDGSFSAFGMSDDQGSLWLTAFVLKSFAQARELIYIDDQVLSEAAGWITGHQNQDGSFDAVGFVTHQELLGGLSGRDALTAYVAVALMEAGEASVSARAVGYLEGIVGESDDAYTAAITAYALALAGSPRSGEAHDWLMGLAEEDENGLHWGGGPMLLPSGDAGLRSYPGIEPNSAAIETTAYATLALIKQGDAFNASRAAKWLVSQRNAFGGYGSTQDTVVTLQALAEYSSGTRADVDLTVTITGDGTSETLRVTQANFDVLQVIEIPVDSQITITASGEGEAISQVVTRYNLPEVEKGEQIMSIDVDYDTTAVEVNDLVTVSVDLAFNPPLPMEAGMIVIDVSVPTGFVPVADTVAAAVAGEARLKRYEVAGRKVIFYVENMLAGERLSFQFKVQAQYPVKAKGVTSQAYSYYQPEIRGETLGEAVTVSGN